MKKNLIIKHFNDAEYQSIHNIMFEKTLHRVAQAKNNTHESDELWVVEHQDVYTLGQSASKETDITSFHGTPVIKTDRGGKITWHGKGQLVMYWLFDLNQLGWKVTDLVSHAEQSIEDVLNTFLASSYYARARKDAPGVYIYDTNNTMLGKIASLGFKVKKGYTYHGIAINLDCDLTAFSLISPCGYSDMRMTRLKDLCSEDKFDKGIFTEQLVANIIKRHENLIPVRDKL